MRRRGVRIALAFAIVAVLVPTALLFLLEQRERDTRAADHIAEATNRPGAPRTAGDATWESDGAVAPAARVLVHGIVVDDTGPTGPGVTVRAEFAQTARGAFATAETDADGVFELRVADTPAWSEAWPVAARADEGGVDWGRLGNDLFQMIASTADGRRLSAPTSVAVEETGPDCWLVLVLERPAVVRARAVDGAGAPVPGAIVRLLSSRGRIEESWQGRASGGMLVATADERGVVETRVVGGRVRAWVRRPDGLFGSSRRADLAPGETCDLGDLEVATRTATYRLKIVDPEGRPLRDAAIRFTAEDMAQRFVPGAHGPHVRGNDGVHDRADETGVVTFASTVGPKPMVVSVGAEGHLPLFVVLDRSSPGVFEHRVQLTPVKWLRIRLEDTGGRALKEEVDVSFHVSRIKDDGGHDFVRFRAPPVLLGPVDAETAHATLEELGPWQLRFLPRPRTKHGMFDADSSTYELPLPGAGHYRVRALVSPGAWTEAYVDADAPSPTVLRVPAGRRVEVVGTPVEGADHWHQWCAWPATADRPAADWPANRKEAGDAGRSGSKLFRDAGLRARLWLPLGYTHLAYRRFEGMIRAPRSLPTDAAAAPPPGAVRVPGRDGRYADERTYRVALPEVAEAPVQVPLPARADPRHAGTVRVQLTLGGRPLAQAGIVVRALWLDSPPSAPGRGASVAQRRETDADGVATLHLRPGEHEIGLTRGLMPTPPSIKVVVEADSDCTVELPAADS